MSEALRPADFLPQHPPMIMLAELISVDVPGVASAVPDTSPGCIFYDPELKGVPACAALEYMAQTMALAVGAEYRRRGGSPKIGFVLGTRRLEVKIATFESGKRYVVNAKCVYDDNEFASFDCMIADPDGATVATALLTAYQPPESMLEQGEVVLEGGKVERWKGE